MEKLAKKLESEYLKTSPVSKAVRPACYYLACASKGRRMTQENVSQIYGVSAPTIRKVYKDVLKKVGDIGDKEYDWLRRELGFGSMGE